MHDKFGQIPIMDTAKSKRPSKSNGINIPQAIFSVFCSFLLKDFTEGVLNAEIIYLKSFSLDAFKFFFVVVFVIYLSGFSIYLAKRHLLGSNKIGDIILAIIGCGFILVSYLSVEVKMNKYLLLLFALIWPTLIISISIERRIFERKT